MEWVTILAIVSCALLFVVSIVLPVMTTSESQIRNAGIVLSKHSMNQAPASVYVPYTTPDVAHYAQYNWKTFHFNLPLVTMQKCSSNQEKYDMIYKLLSSIDPPFVNAFGDMFQQWDDDALLYTVIHNSFMCYFVTPDGSPYQVELTSHRATNFITRCNMKIINAHKNLGIQPFTFTMDTQRKCITHIRVGDQPPATPDMPNWASAKRDACRGLVALCRCWLFVMYRYLSLVHRTADICLTKADMTYKSLTDGLLHYRTHAKLITHELAHTMDDNVVRVCDWMYTRLHNNLNLSLRMDILNKIGRAHV